MVLTGPKVLLVEDDASLRQAIERLFTAAGLDCTAFASAEAMLSANSGKGIACVVSDLKLPAMSGLSLLAEWRRRGERAPFILITAHDTPGLDAEALRLGATPYLANPFLGTALLELVRMVIAAAGW